MYVCLTFNDILKNNISIVFSFLKNFFSFINNKQSQFSSSFSRNVILYAYKKRTAFMFDLFNIYANKTKISRLSEKRKLVRFI